jgi:hypothetical protein
MNTIREKIESNELIWEIQRRINELLWWEKGRMTSRTKEQVEEVLDQEREKLKRHIEFNIR